ncbi:hypothetical protein GALMADRAFT_211803 [Galerina marginata CBS 339.88]|uniref:Uncharacterized protein n=1 Tax=Galerina marginata (strain CBS 339.88) TaxID=685588 RepID=A0A067SVK0_GALM3|nr:hypothetical protein GALMADRAFT_211803 [Galerina marginata CBS 339.88]
MDTGHGQLTRPGIPQLGADTNLRRTHDEFILQLQWFEEGTSQAQRAPTLGPSRLRTESSAGASTPPPVTGPQEGSQPQSTLSLMPPSSSSSASAAPPPLTTDAPAPPGLPLTHNPVAETPYSSISKNHNGSTPSPAPAAEPKYQPETAQNTASSAPAPTPSLSPASTSNPNHPPSVSELGKLSLPPPSSFTSASATRSESRASVFSYQSYATAADSLTPSSAQAFFSDADADSDGDAGDMTSEPSTPKMGGQHVLEMTDATVVPDAWESDDDRRRTILAAGGAAGTSSLGRTFQVLQGRLKHQRSEIGGWGTVRGLAGGTIMLTYSTN